MFRDRTGAMHCHAGRRVRKRVHDAGALKAGSIGRREPKNAKQGRTVAMKSLKVMLPKAMWMGTLGVAAMLIGWTPSCKAQEVSPAIFTDTGVEDVYPAAKPVAKKTVKVQVAAHTEQGVTTHETSARKQNAHRAVRKVNVSAPGL